MLIRALVCSAMAGGRLVEMAHSQRNLRQSDGPPTRQGHLVYVLMIALHAVTIAGTLLFGKSRPAWAWLAVLVAVQPIRVWVLWILGERWNARGIVSPETPVETRGPYRYIRHPNYSVVAVELLALPLAFGLRRPALMATLANAALLAARIRDEERALMTLPGYREHFSRKPRFLPFLV